MERSNGLTSETKRQQQLLAQYCRTGEIPEGIQAKHDRLPHYRRLVYNVIFDTLSSAYPITKTFLGKKKWKFLIDDFFKNYSSQKAQIWQMPYGLFDYLNEYPSLISKEFPFLNELVYFEWLEIELYAEKNIPFQNSKSTVEKITLNPHHRIMQLTYPFHKFSVKEAIKNSNVSYIILFRNLETYKVEFVEVSVLIAQVVQALSENEMDLLYTLKKLGSNYSLTNQEFLQKQAKDLLQQFKKQGLFL